MDLDHEWVTPIVAGVTAAGNVLGRSDFDELRCPVVIAPV